MAKRIYKKVEKDENGLSAKARESLQIVIDKFQKGDLGDLQKVVLFRLPDEVPASKWTWRNKFLAYVQTGGVIDCRTAAEWQRQGYKIKKGISAVWIMAPRFIKKEEEVNGHIIERSIYIGAYPAHRIPATCVEPIIPGEETPLPGYTPTELPPLFELAERLGIDVAYRPTPGDRLGDCADDGSQINLGTDDWRVWFHELSHAIHTKIEGNLSQSKFSHADLEVVADVTACVLGQLYGYDYSGRTWEYINRFAPNSAFEACMKALSVIEKILDFIFEEVEEPTELELEMA